MRGATRRMGRVAALTLPALALLAGVASAQPAWPTRPIRLIVPQPPGGVTDQIVRPLLEPLRQRLGQPMVIENRPGGNNAVGLEACALAPPDGETFCLVSVEVMSMYPHLEPALFARWASVRPVTLLARGTGVIYANPAVPADDLAGFVRWARGQPQLNYGSFGVGSSAHVLFEYLKARDGLQIEHVPHRGAVEAFNETAAGRVQVSYVALGFALPHLQAGRVRPLAVLGNNRVPLLPGTPSLGELGYDFAYAGGWWGIAAPGRLPDGIAERFAQAVGDAMRDPEYRARYLDPQGYEGVGSTPQEFVATIAEERRRGGEMLRAMGMVGRN